MQDKAFKKHVMAYAADEALFFKEWVPLFTFDTSKLADRRV